jgi:phage shock protein C
MLLYVCDMNPQKLWRKKDDKVIAGICSGLGQYFNSDPILFRFAFLALLFAGGSSIIIYIILWIVLPSEPISMKSENVYTETIYSSDTNNNIKEIQSTDSTSLVFGLLLISGGVLLLLNNLVPYLKMQKLWPVILIMIGLGLLLNKKKDKNN